MINEYIARLEDGTIKSLRCYSDSLDSAVLYCERIGYNWVSITNRVTGEFQSK